VSAVKIAGIVGIIYIATGPAIGAPKAREGEEVRTVLLLSPTKLNPRNSEGDFLQLRDGKVLFVYTHFTGGAGDHARACLAQRESEDGGHTWSGEDAVLVEGEGAMNVMSVSLLRLDEERIGLFYLRKNSLSDCRPAARISSDEGATWGPPADLVPESQIGYYVMNNDRVVRLKNGRLVAPVAQHHGEDWKEWTPYGRIMCYLSDDSGGIWRRSSEAPEPEEAGGKRVMLQEPGVVELRDGRLLMFCRTDAGCQYVSYSEDGGETWSRPRPSSIVSPRSPASIERIPATGDLLLVWNNHEGIDAALAGKRTPLNTAISRDEGETWEHKRTLESDPDGWYCYTAVEFVVDHVLLAYCAGNQREKSGLNTTRVTRLPVEWLWGPDAAGGRSHPGDQDRNHR